MTMQLDPKYHDLLGGIKLSTEQIEGVEFLINRIVAILAFQTGLGKTLVSLTAMRVLQDKYGKARGIIVCPIKAVKIFKKELITRLGYAEHEIGLVTNQEMEYDINHNKIFIITNTALQKYYSIIPDLAARNKLVLIVDEAHQLQDNQSKFYTLLEEVKVFFTAIWFTTATPVLNDLDSLYNIVSFLDKKFFGTKTRFLDTYTKYVLKDIYIKGGKKRKVRDTTGYKNMGELKTKLESICIMRQRKYNLKFTNVSESLTPDEAAIYERVSEGIIGDEERTFGQRMHDLQRLVDNAYADDMVCELDSTKEKLLIKTLKALISKDFSAVVYVDYLDTIDRVEKVLYENQDEIGFNKIYQIKGSVDLKVREMVEDAIDKRDIILVTKAGTESINLQKANCVVMYDIPFSVKDCIQLIGRVTRMDTEHDVQYVVIIWTKGTIDEYKYLLFLDYANLVKQLLGADANLPSNLQEIDRKNIQTLKDKLLWHYKDVDKKEINKKKKILKVNLVTCRSEEMNDHLATFYINLNPINQPIAKTKRMSIITPKEGDYDAFINGGLPFSVLRNRYIDNLKTPEGKIAMGTIVDAIINKGSIVVLVDDYGIGEAFRYYVLENVKL